MLLLSPHDKNSNINNLGADHLFAVLAPASSSSYFLSFLPKAG
jgi:hypothetical protein